MIPAMARFVLLLIALMLPSMASAADRSYSVTDFDRIRVEGPFEVVVVTGKPPSGRAQADERTLDLLTMRVEGNTLTIALGGKGWGETPKGVRTLPIITVTTHDLRVAIVNAGARLRVDRMKGQRLDLALRGSGQMTISRAEADQVNALVIGTGSITVAGRSLRASLSNNGLGLIDASALNVNDLTVRLEGPGEIKAAARNTAKVTTTGLGKVTVSGRPSCTVDAIAGGPVVCGTN